MFCKVKGCRFKHSHTTKGHLCPKCGKYGHGQVECRSDHLKIRLIPFHDETLPLHLQCNVPGCLYKEYHTKEAHHCPKCKERHTDECIIDNEIVKLIIQSNQNLIDAYLNDNQYSVFYSGMGSTVYVKRKYGIVSGLFMHSDSWGQYSFNGITVGDERPKLNKFINGLTEINIIKDHAKTIKCPICRTINNPQKAVFGILGTEKCSICLDSISNVQFDVCKHNITCISCYKTLLIN